MPQINCRSSWIFQTFVLWFFSSAHFSILRNRTTQKIMSKSRFLKVNVKSQCILSHYKRSRLYPWVLWCNYSCVYLTSLVTWGLTESEPRELSKFYHRITEWLKLEGILQPIQHLKIWLTLPIRTRKLPDIKILMRELQLIKF